MTQTLEEIDKILDHPLVDAIPLPLTHNMTFVRDRYFKIKGLTYRIEWWLNVMYMHQGDTRTIFHKLEINNTWPLSPQVDALRLLGSDGQVRAVIPLGPVSGTSDASKVDRIRMVCAMADEWSVEQRLPVSDICMSALRDIQRIVNE